MILKIFMSLNRETSHTFNLKRFYRNITSKSIKDIKSKLSSIILLSIFYFFHIYGYISVDTMACALLIYIFYITNDDLSKRIVVVVENICYKIIYLKSILLKAKRTLAVQQFLLILALLFLADFRGNSKFLAKEKFIIIIMILLINVCLDFKLIRNFRLTCDHYIKN